MDGGVQKGLEDLALGGDEDAGGVEGASDGHPQPGAQDEAQQEACAGGVGLGAGGGGRGPISVRTKRPPPIRPPMAFKLCP
jgi:hypothetical protein